MLKELKNEFKETSIGLIPKDWEVKRLGELGEIISGLTYSPDDINENGVLVLRSSNIQDRQLEFNDNVFVNVKDGKYNPLKVDDILICVRNGSKSLIGKNTLITKDVEGFAFGAFMAVFRSNQNKYLFQLFDTDYFNSEIHKNLGATINSINGSDLKQFKFPIPPISEQKAIADCLSAWDKASETLNTLITQKELSKKALAQKLLTGKLRIKGFDNEKWVELKADKVFKNNTDKSHNGELEILSASQERGILPRRLNNIDIKYDENSLSSYKKVEIGDYVISLRSFQGGIEYSEFEGIVSPAYTILKEKVPISKVFYKVYFKTETFINRLNTIIYGIRDGKQISFTDFATLKIPYPSIEEQTAIANVLQCANDELQLLKKKLEQIKVQKKGLMQQLLTGKVRTI